MTGRSLITSDAVKDVLRAAKDGKTHAGLNETALEKCHVKGWTQCGEGEVLSLTAEGRKACEALKL